MTKEMLKFVNVKQETPEKEKLVIEKAISMKFMKITLLIKQQNNPADALNVEFLSAKFTVH